MQNALYSPFVSRLNPKRRWFSVGHPFIHLVGALSGKRGFDMMRVEMTFLWMSEFKCERVEWGPFNCPLLTGPTLQITKSAGFISLNKLISLSILSYIYTINEWKPLVSGIQPYWSAKFFGGVIYFQVDGARHFHGCSRDEASICIVIFLYLPYFLLLM